jgi:hypothetical protein
VFSENHPYRGAKYGSSSINCPRLNRAFVVPKSLSR